MYKNIKVEAENNELILENSNGDKVIIPANKRNWVKQKLSEGCHNCIDSLVETLPVASQYAQDGSVYPPNKKVKVNQDGQIKEYDISSPEYKDLYNSGKLMSYDKNSNTYISTPLKEVVITAEAPQWLKDKRQFEKEYSKDRFIDEAMPKFSRSMGISSTNMNPNNVAEYDKIINDKVVENIFKRKPTFDTDYSNDRLKTLQGFTQKELELIKNSSYSSKIEPSIWSKFEQGLLSVGNAGSPVAFKNPSLSQEEAKKEDNPLNILQPLSIPSKMVQSAYKDNYSFKDALKGKKNNAGIVEDIVTDPLNLVGAGLVGKLSKTDKIIDATKVGSKVLNKGEALSRLSNENKINLSKTSNNFANKSKNVSESLTYELTTLHKKLNPSYQKRAEKELEYANKWQEEWYNHPETMKRLQSLSDEFNTYRNQQVDLINKKNKILRENSDNLKHGFTQEDLNDIYRDIPYNTENDWTEIMRRINDKNYISTFQSKDAKLQKILKGEERTHKGNYGISGHYLDKDYSGKRQNLVDKYSSKIRSTGIHEGNHGLTEGNRLIPISEREEMVKIFGQSKEIPVRNEKGGFNTYDEYLEDPTEIYARIMELREYMGKKPGELVASDEIERLIQLGKNGNTPVNFYFFSKIQDKEKLKKLFNRLPAIAPLFGISYLQSQNQNKSEQ